MLFQVLEVLVYVTNGVHQLVHYSRYFVGRVIVHFDEFVLCPFFVSFNLLIRFRIIVLSSAFSKLDSLSDVTEVSINIIILSFYAHKVLVKFMHYAGDCLVNDFRYIVPFLGRDFENSLCRLLNLSMTSRPGVDITVFIWDLQRRYILFAHFII